MGQGAILAAAVQSKAAECMCMPPSPGRCRSRRRCTRRPWGPPHSQPCTGWGRPRQRGSSSQQGRAAHGEARALGSDTAHKAPLLSGTLPTTPSTQALQALKSCCSSAAHLALLLAGPVLVGASSAGQRGIRASAGHVAALGRDAAGCGAVAGGVGVEGACGRRSVVRRGLL